MQAKMFSSCSSDWTRTTPDTSLLMRSIVRRWCAVKFHNSRDFIRAVKLAHQREAGKSCARVRDDVDCNVNEAEFVTAGLWLLLDGIMASSPSSSALLTKTTREVLLSKT